MLGLLEAAGEKLSRKKAIDGAVRRSHDLEEAERLLNAGLREMSLERSSLATLKRSDRRKIGLARLIRSRTAVPNPWIARELSMGHVTSVSRYCSEKFKHYDLPRFTL
jgi:hypothetical protein